MGDPGLRNNDRSWHCLRWVEVDQDPGSQVLPNPACGWIFITAGFFGVIIGASLIGGPVSTTQVVGSAIMGAGAAERKNKVRWGVAQEIGMAWLLTIPTTALVGAGIYMLISSIIVLFSK